jgi:hypothetical protein
MTESNEFKHDQGLSLHSLVELYLVAALPRCPKLEHFTI